MNFAAGKAPENPPVTPKGFLNHIERERVREELRSWLEEADRVLDQDEIQEIVEEVLGLG